MSQLERIRNFKTLYRARQNALVGSDIPKHPNEQQIVKERNNNIIEPKIRSMTPLARRIPMKLKTKIPQQPNINPPDSLKEEGVCTNCINNLIANQHHPRSISNQHHLGDNNSKSLNSLFDLQEKQNEYQKERIITSINKRMNLAEKVANSLPKTNEKERFIDFVEAEQFTLNECTPDLHQRKAIAKYNQKEELFNKNLIKPRIENRKVIDYYERVANTCQNQAIIVNSSNQYKNPYLPSIKQYNSILSEQIESKKNARKSEKQIDHDLEKQVYDINKLKQEQETKDRMESFQRLRSDFIANNSNLISFKQKKDRFDRLTDISNEVKQSEEIKEQNKKIRNKEIESKLAQRKQLQLSLDNHINFKTSLLKQEKENKLSDYYHDHDINIYREPIRKEEMSYCNECHKKYQKRLIFPKSEYHRLLSQQK